VITEYGIAQLRGKTDSEVIAALLNIADARFQNELLGQAAGKLPRHYRIPEAHRNNTPAALERRSRDIAAQGCSRRFRLAPTDLPPQKPARHGHNALSGMEYLR
jgi:hypothetical protein